ncbi:hypothetical protein BsLM_2516 [Bacillus sp. LM 4-2]|nr:hypothetical protein BsLM_2516 [Bacillus sp. LM 4-2]
MTAASPFILNACSQAPGTACKKAIITRTENVTLASRFFKTIPLYLSQSGGIKLNDFEKNVQSKRNDAVDSAVGFVVSFGFFAFLFVMATVIHLVGS